MKTHKQKPSGRSSRKARAIEIRTTKMRGKEIDNISLNTNRMVSKVTLHYSGLYCFHVIS